MPSSETWPAWPRHPEPGPAFQQRMASANPVRPRRCISSRVPRETVCPCTSSHHLESPAMRHTLLVIAAPIVLLLASACAPAPAPAAGAGLPPEQITLTGTDDFRFNPSTITLKAGQ